MKKAPSRPFMAFLAGVATLLTCYLAAQKKWDGIGFPIPWQYHDHGWTPIDYRILVADVVLLLLSYYGLIRGFFLMVTSPHRLPFSRRRAYGEDPTSWRRRR